MTDLIVDAHYHLDFWRDRGERRVFAEAASAAGVQLVAQTVIPSGYLDLAVDHLSPHMPSLGFHPWWIGSPDDVDAELEIFAEQVGTTRFVGEIGLDFSPRRLEHVPPEVQRSVFRRILALVANAASVATAPIVMSIHAVRAVGAVLDDLEALGIHNRQIVPVIHRFGGTSDELTRLLRLGGRISVHPTLLETKRGRAYVTQAPADRLLLESDLPGAPIPAGPGTGSPRALDAAVALRATLERTRSRIAELRGDARPTPSFGL